MGNNQLKFSKISKDLGIYHIPCKQKIISSHIAGYSNDMLTNCAFEINGHINNKWSSTNYVNICKQINSMTQLEIDSIFKNIKLKSNNEYKIHLRLVLEEIVTKC